MKLKLNKELNMHWIGLAVGIIFSKLLNFSWFQVVGVLIGTYIVYLMLGGAEDETT